MIDRAERTIDIQSYLIRDDVSGNLIGLHLAAAADRGVRVAVVTNSLASNNHTVVHAGYSKYRKPLIDAGVARVVVATSDQQAIARGETDRVRVLAGVGSNHTT